MDKDIFVWLGNDTYVPCKNIELLTSYEQPAAKKIVKQAKEEGRLYDFSRGRAKETVALLKSGTVIISPIESYRISEETGVK